MKKIFTLLFFLPFSFCIAQQFPCDGKLYFLRYNNSQNYVSYVDGYTTATPSVHDVAPLTATNANALGGNPKDNYLYFLGTGNDLTRFDANGNTTVVCPALTNASRGCFDYLGRYWVVDNTLFANKLIAYDINTCTIVKGPYTVPITFSGIDLVFSASDCCFYMGDGGQVIKIDTNGNVVANIAQGFGGGGSYGGFAIGSDGNLYGMPNNNSQGDYINLIWQQILPLELFTVSQVERERLEQTWLHFPVRHLFQLFLQLQQAVVLSR